MKLIIKLLIKFVICRDKKSFIRLLGILECGFHDFCFKKSLQARSENRNDLADKLLHHAKSEDAHARMLWGLIDGQNRPHRNSKHKEVFHGVTLSHPDYFTENGRTILNCRDGKIRQWQNTDGISLRYASARAFFVGKKAEDYDWRNALAFMCVGEELGKIFYSVLAKELDEAIFRKISDDENDHASYLWEALKSEVGLGAYWFICKWHLRKFIALTFIPYDIYQISRRKKTSA